MITRTSVIDMKIPVFQYGEDWPDEVILHPDNYTNLI